MTKQEPQDHAEISNRLKDIDGMNAALKRAARDAVREHAREGRKIVVWRDGQVVWEDATIEEAPKQ